MLGIVAYGSSHTEVPAARSDHADSRSVKQRASNQRAMQAAWIADAARCALARGPRELPGHVGAILYAIDDRVGALSGVVAPREVPIDDDVLLASGARARCLASEIVGGARGAALALMLAGQMARSSAVELAMAVGLRVEPLETPLGDALRISSGAVVIGRTVTDLVARFEIEHAHEFAHPAPDESASTHATVQTLVTRIMTKRRWSPADFRAIVASSEQSRRSATPRRTRTSPLGALGFSSVQRPRWINAPQTPLEDCALLFGIANALDAVAPEDRVLVVDHDSLATQGFVITATEHLADYRTAHPPVAPSALRWPQLAGAATPEDDNTDASMAPDSERTESS